MSKICNRINPVERDVVTAIAVADGIMNGANIVRVHNVGYSADAVKYCAASRKRSGSSNIEVTATKSL